MSISVCRICIQPYPSPVHTPIPHIRSFMSIWLLHLPFGLWPTLGWDAVPASFVITFLILG
jgi:hypothetical protein